MAKINPAKFRQERSKELRQLAHKLVESITNFDPSPLYKAAAMCQNSKGLKDSYGYNLEQLSFQIETPRHTLPSDAGNYLNLELSVTLQGVCDLESNDPFSELAVDIEVSTDPKKNSCAWHLDRHILGEDAHEANEVHPLYHFQYGGKNMYPIENFGNVLLLDPPRLVHPPMDAILAIDFVLSNFVATTWRKLREDSVYRKIIADAQKNLWLPYFQSILEQWGTTKERKDSHASLLLPNLILS